MEKRLQNITNAGLSIIYMAIIASFTGCVKDENMSDKLMGAGTPKFKSADVISRTASTIEVKAEIAKANGAKITRRGFCYDASQNPTLETGQSIDDGAQGVGAYTLTLRELLGNTTYYIRPFAVNSQGTEYGDELVVSTNNGLGIVQTTKTSTIRAITARTGGKILSRGEGNIISRGVFCWSVAVGFAARDSIADHGDADEYDCQLSNLTPATQYCVQAFFTNTYGTVTGSIDTFMTNDGLPLVSDIVINGISFTDATFSSTASISDETAPIIERGFCWMVKASNSTPTIDNDTVRRGSGAGPFNGTITGLVAQTDYIVRAYAKSDFGIAYSSNTVSIRTKTDIPTVQTDETITPVNGSAMVGGIVIDEGIAPIDSAGICWSFSNPTPTLADSVMKLPATVGYRFSGTLSGLRGGRTYYVRAYASNSKGVSYGDVTTFVTPPVFASKSNAFSGVRLSNSTAYFAINDQLYLLGGDTGPSYSDELWTYNSSTDKWSQRQSFKGGAAKWQTAIAYGNGAFVSGGTDGSGKGKGALYYYDAVNNMWDEWIGKDTFYLSAGYVQGNNLFYVGGKSDTVRSDVWSFQVFNATSDTWQKKPDFPEKQYGGIAVVINSVAYAGLGKNSSEVCNGKLWATADGAETWTLKTTCSLYSGGILAGVKCSDRIYVVDEAYYLLEYNPATDVWTRKSQLPSGSRNLHCMYEVGSKIYIGLGSTNTFVVYDPVWDN